MKRLIYVLVLLGFTSQLAAADVIETKTNRKYNGKIVKIVDDKIVIKTEEGNMVGIPKSSLARIQRGREVFDFVSGERYYLEVRRPFLPFMVVSAACGAYSVVKYQDYQRSHARYEKEKQEADAADAVNIQDTSKKDLSTSVILAVCSAGTFIMALKPMEVKVPIGKIKIGMAPNGVRLSLNF
jgi:hypothetical protein